MRLQYTPVLVGLTLLVVQSLAFPQFQVLLKPGGTEDGDKDGEIKDSPSDATFLTSTKVIVEGTRPHAPFNITATSAVYSVTLNWLPGYSGGPDFRQDYVLWYRLLGESKWETVPVTPPGSTRITLRNLSPGKPYQFQIIGSNELGESPPSEIINVTTKDKDVDTIPKTTTETPKPVGHVVNTMTSPMSETPLPRQKRQYQNSCHGRWNWREGYWSYGHWHQGNWEWIRGHCSHYHNTGHYGGHYGGHHGGHYGGHHRGHYGGHHGGHYGGHHGGHYGGHGGHYGGHHGGHHG